MIAGKLTSKAQTTSRSRCAPRCARRRRDTIAYAIEGDRVILTRAPAPQDDPFANFDEWAGEADSKAHAGF